MICFSFFLMCVLMETSGFPLAKQVIHRLNLSETSLSVKNTKDRSRRQWMKDNLFTIMPASVSLVPLVSSAAETVGKDEDCNSPQCLGVWGGLLANCPHDKVSMTMGASCASSQDDTPGVFAEPWDYSEVTKLDWKIQMERLIPAIIFTSSKRGDDVQILKQENRYIRVLFTDNKTLERSVGEFYFTPDDTTVQFRVGSLVTSSSNASMMSAAASLSSMKNLERCEAIRKQLGYLKLPILRNRQRLFFFGESDFDAFGPGSASIGSPAEMRRDELEGLPEFDPNLKTDISQKFPFVEK